MRASKSVARLLSRRFDEFPEEHLVSDQCLDGTARNLVLDDVEQVAVDRDNDLLEPFPHEDSAREALGPKGSGQKSGDFVLDFFKPHCVICVLLVGGGRQDDRCRTLSVVAGNRSVLVAELIVEVLDECTAGLYLGGACCSPCHRHRVTSSLLDCDLNPLKTKVKRVHFLRACLF